MAKRHKLITAGVMAFLIIQTAEGDRWTALSPELPASPPSTQIVSEIVTVGEGESIRIVAQYGVSDWSFSKQIRFPGVTDWLPAVTSVFSEEYLPGPLEYRAIYNTDSGSSEIRKPTIMFHIENNTGSKLLPTGSIVIPSDTHGQVQIILEASSDLLDWHEALPGLYDASTERRFFRLRAVTFSNG